MNKFLKTALFVLAFTVPTAAMALPIVLFDDTFASETVGNGKIELANWDVTQGNVDVVGAGFVGVCDFRCIDLDGTTSNVPAVIETKVAFDFLAGTQYELFFDISGLNVQGETGGINDSFTVSIGSFLSATYEDYSAPLSPILAFTANANAQATIIFTMLTTPNNFGPILSQVTLTQLDTSTVPVPAALPLFGTGLAILGLVGWRRKRKMAA